MCLLAELGFHESRHPLTPRPLKQTSDAEVSAAGVFIGLPVKHDPCGGWWAVVCPPAQQVRCWCGYLGGGQLVPCQSRWNAAADGPGCCTAAVAAHPPRKCKGYSPLEEDSADGLRPRYSVSCFKHCSVPTRKPESLASPSVKWMDIQQAGDFQLTDFSYTTNLK